MAADGPRFGATGAGLSEIVPGSERAGAGFDDRIVDEERTARIEDSRFA